MISAGQDHMIKVWDYEVQKTIPYFFQCFIGHTYPVAAILFNPTNNGQVITIGEHDGIFIWDFNGDVENDYHADQPRE
jgi:WD40 repeat protein